MSILRRIRSRRLFVLLLAMYGLVAPFASTARASTVNVVIFSYNTDYIEQQIDLSQYAGQITSWSVEVLAKDTQGGPDKIGIGVQATGPSGSPILSTNMDGSTLSNLSSSWSTTTLTATVSASNDWASLAVRIFGKDAENWGGNYGPSVRSISVKLKLNESPEWTDITSLITNPDFSSVSNNSPTGWSSNRGWAPCQGVQSATLCVGAIDEGPPPTTTTTTTTSTTTTTTTTPPLVQNGLTYKTYASSGGSPQFPTAQSQSITEGTSTSIDYNWGGGQVLDSGRSNGVIIEFVGMIRPPENAEYEMCAYSDDGFRLYLDDVIAIDNWFDRGPRCGPAVLVDFVSPEPKTLRAFYYENGGGAVAQLRYRDSSGQWLTVPASWYTSEPSSPPTTTTTTTTTSTTTTTTPPTTTTTLPPLPDNVLWAIANEGGSISLDAPNGREFNNVIFLSYGTPTGSDGYFTVDNNCHASLTAAEIDLLIIGENSFSIDASNSVFGDPCPGTYKVLKIAATHVEAAPQTTTTSPTTTVIIPPPIIDGGGPSDGNGGGPDDAPIEESPEDPVDDVQPEPEPEEPIDGEPAEPPTSEDEVSEPAPDGENDQTPEETPVGDEGSNGETEPAPEEPSPVEPAPEEQIDETPGEPIEEIADDLSEEEAKAIVDELLSDGVTESEAVSLASSVAAVHALTAEEATEVFAAIDIDQISEEQVAEIVEAVQDAPLEVREAFEEEINVFGGGALDNYVPVGSVISVGERRVVIAATGVMLAGVPMPSRAPAPAPTAPSPSGTTSSSGGSDSSENSSRKRGK